jgi:hypothetical protein
VQNQPRLFLKAGERVTHRSYLQWGVGVVEEMMTSNVPGGTCLVRIRFQDGRLRVFHNDLDNQGCCYYFGLRHYDDGTQSGKGIQRSLLTSLDSEEY